MTNRKLLGLAATATAGAALTWLFAVGMRTTPSHSENATQSAATLLPDGRARQRDELGPKQVGVEQLGSPKRPQPDAAAQPPERDRETRESDPSDGFDDASLADLGYSPNDIQYIRDLWERSKEDESAEDDKVGKVDWVPPSLRMVDIRRGLRADLGDAFYDAMLHATQQPNRARIGNVIASSPAAAAGLRIRDVVLSYDGERVFEPADLERLSEGAESGELVSLKIRRAGAEIEILAAGGALGIRYFPGREIPSPQ